MPDHETDEEIVDLYKNGNEKMLKVLIDRYSSPLFNFTARITNKNEAPDIIQEVFIKIWKNLHSFKPEKASFKTWIFTVTKNTITDFLRKKRSLSFSDIGGKENEDLNSFAENIPDENLLPDQALQKLQDSQVLNEALQKLRPDYQEILILHYQEEMTFEEIGKILDKPLNTIKSQHRRALIELKKILI